MLCVLDDQATAHSIYDLSVCVLTFRAAIFAFSFCILLQPQQLANTSKSNNTSGADSNNSHLPLELQQYDAKLVEKIQNEILQDCGKRPVVFADIAGLEFAKKCVQEIICW